MRLGFRCLLINDKKFFLKKEINLINQLIKNTPTSFKIQVDAHFGEIKDGNAQQLGLVVPFMQCLNFFTLYPVKMVLIRPVLMVENELLGVFSVARNSFADRSERLGLPSSRRIQESADSHRSHMSLSDEYWSPPLCLITRNSLCGMSVVVKNFSSWLGLS